MQLHSFPGFLWFPIDKRAPFTLAQSQIARGLAFTSSLKIPLTGHAIAPVTLFFQEATSFIDQHQKFGFTCLLLLFQNQLFRV